MADLTQDSERLRAAKQAVDLKLQNTKEELEHEQSLKAQQASDLQQMHSEHEQSVVAHEQLQAELSAAAERQSELDVKAEQQIEELACKEAQLTGQPRLHF